MLFDFRPNCIEGYDHQCKNPYSTMTWPLAKAHYVSAVKSIGLGQSCMRDDKYEGSCKISSMWLHLNLAACYADQGKYLTVGTFSCWESCFFSQCMTCRWPHSLIWHPHPLQQTSWDEDSISHAITFWYENWKPCCSHENIHVCILWENMAFASGRRPLRQTVYIKRA